MPGHILLICVKHEEDNNWFYNNIVIGTEGVRGVMKKSFLVWIFMIFVCLACVSAAAGEPDLYQDGNVQKLFTSENGLLATAATAIAQTGDGMIWIGGYGGLVRYDGETFEVFDEEISGISDLMSGKDGSLWIASSDKGLFCYKDHELFSIPFEDGTTDFEAECLAEDADGKVWFGTEDGIGMVDADRIARKPEIPELAGSYINSLHTVEGQVYCVTRKGELFCYDGSSAVRIKLGSDSRNVRCIEYDAYHDMFYVGTTGNMILEYDRNFSRRGILTTRSLQCINDICCIQDGEIWVCADNGIAVMLGSRIRIQRMMIDNSVDQVMIDHEGNKWFVSSRQGILEVSRSRFCNISQIAGLPQLVVNAVQKVDDRLYIGHDDGLVILNTNTYEMIEDPDFSRLNDARIRDILLDSRGRLWFCTRAKGLLCLDQDKTWKIYKKAVYPELGSDSFRCVTECWDGRILAGTDEGAYFIDGPKVSCVVNDPSSLSLRILGVLQDGDSCYLGTDGYGVFVVKDGEITSHLTASDGLSSNAVMKICKSKTSDRIWMVTRMDICWLDEDLSIHNVSNFPSINCMDIILTESEDMWILSGGGIYRTTEESLVSGEDLLYTLYHRADGIPFEVTANGRQCRDEDILYISGSGGVMSMNISTAEDREDAEYPLLIDYIEVDDSREYLKKDQQISLGTNAQRIVLGTHVITYRSENPYVFYFLEGFDNDRQVQQLRNLPKISYTNLPGGNYTFHFGILDHYSGDVVQEVTVPVQKEFKWHERNAVRAAGILVTILLLGLIAWFIINRILRRTHQKLQYQYEIKEKHHLQEIAYKDYLTGMYTRNYLEIWKEKVFPKAGDPITFIFLDVNNLKVINDNFGHKLGDKLLVETANLLEKNFPSENDVVIRMGGDEFLILCCGIDRKGARRKIEEVAAEAAQISIADTPISFCYGICTLSKEEFDFEEGLRLSDVELLKKKDEYHGRA